MLQELRDASGLLSMPTRETLAAEAFSYTARYDNAITRWFAERQDDFPPVMMSAFEKVIDLSYGENPHQRAAYYAQVGSRMHVLSMVAPARRQGAVVQQRARPQRRRGCSSTSSSSRPARSSSTTTRAACAVGGSRSRPTERAFACDPQSAFGGVICFNRAVDARARRGARRPVRRGRLRAAVHRRARSRSSRRKPNLRILEDNERRRVEHRRARPQARDGRPARAGPRHRPRGPLGDGGRHRAQADRARVGRDAVRLEGLQARALQRDRARRATSRRSASARAR